MDELSDELAAVQRSVSAQARCWVDDCGVSSVEIEVIEEVGWLFVNGHRRAGTRVALELS
jgi:hypothetical protein